MNQNIINIIFTFAILYFSYNIIVKENMTTDGLSNLIKSIYLSDVNHIRVISKLANDITKKGKITIPENVKVKLNSLSVDGNCNFNKLNANNPNNISTINGNTNIEKTNITGEFSTHRNNNIKGNIKVENKITFNGPTEIKKKLFVKNRIKTDKLYLDRDGLFVKKNGNNYKWIYNGGVADTDLNFINAKYFS